MASIRKLAGCIGLPPAFAIVGNFFGYASAPPWTLAPSQTNLPQRLSLLTQVKRIQQRHFHLNGIRVGTGAGGVLSPANEQAVDCAVHVTREAYAAVGIGIGRFERHWMIPLSQGTGFDIINDDDEAEDLVDTYSVPNDGMDCFLVDDFLENKIGFYPSKSDGVVVEIRSSNFLGTGRTMAHELGHYFGLGHENDQPTNLMCQTKFAAAMPGSAQLNAEQVSEILEDDHIKGACT